MSFYRFAFTTLFLALSVIGCDRGETAATRPPPATIAATVAPTVPAAQPTDVPTQPTVAPTSVAESPEIPGTSFVWAKLESPTAPPARYDHALALDTDNRQLVLFGGRAGGQIFGDTWLYNLETNQWRQIAAAGPSPRFGFASVYDPLSRAVYLFGGQRQDFFNDTWKFDLATETWAEVQTQGTKPDIRYGHGVTLDSQNNRLVISHGFARDGRHDDTWALDLATSEWSELTPAGDKPLKRCLHDIAYAPDTNMVYLFGGCSSGFGPCPQGDLWALDRNTNQWTLASPVGDIPSARENPSIVIDSTTGNLILFGGKADGNVNDLWIFDPALKNWAQISAEGPTARKSHDAVFDPSGSRMFLFGGNTGDGATNDLWVLAQDQVQPNK